MAEEAERRAEVLGYKPQKEIVYNKLLPYADQLDQESAELFASIKSNLVKAFLAREVRPGCALWTSRLRKYMKIYGLKFSKEDHICLIKLYYELLTLPNLEPTRINKFAGTLCFLLKKKELLSRDDLQLEWRPLYDLYTHITKKSSMGISMYRYLSTLEIVLDTLMKCAKTYFPASATQEILDEMRPMLCPYSARDINRGIMLLCSLLPVEMKPAEAENGYRLWFEEFMNLWEVCHNANLWENNMAWLMSQLACHHIGYIGWDQYVPIMFVRFIRSLQLPVGYKRKQSSKCFKIDISTMTNWIVSALGGPTDLVFVHLTKFMQTLESYYHSANTGRWTPKICEFMKKISLHFVNRIHNERFKKPTWENTIPDSHKLSDADIERFVMIMKPCVEHMVYSRHHQDATYTFNYLASLRPDIIVPLLLDKLYVSMESLTEPHKLTSAMTSVTSVARYMVQGKRVNYPEGPTHIIPLLFNLLPGIDPNDMRKCYMTFNFIVQFVNMIPLINSSEASQYYDDMTEEEHIICEATAGLEDFVLQFFDKLCIWVESNSLEMTRLEQNDVDRRKTRAEMMAEQALVTVISSVLTQSSAEIYMSALKKMYNFATTRIFETKLSGKMVAMICQSFGRINPKETARLFIPHLCEVIENLLGEGDELMTEENLDEELLYNLMLLSEVIDINSELLNYMDRLTKILDRILFMTSLQATALGAHMLNLILTSLTFIQPTEFRSSTKPYDMPLKDHLSVRDWGKPGQIGNLNIDWYMPQEKEVACVQTLLERYLIPQMDKLKEYASGKINLTRTQLRKIFKIISACMGCNTVLPMWKEPALDLMPSVVENWVFELIVGSPYQVYMPDGSNIRKAIADTMHEVQKRILRDDEGDTKSIFSIIYIYDVLLFNKFRGRDFESHWKHFHTLKGMLADQLHKNKMHLRHVLVDRVMLQQEFRNECRSCSFTATHKQILLDLFTLSICNYSEMRCVAQIKVYNCINTFAYCYFVLLDRIKEVLQMNSVEHHEQFKGCLYLLLGPKSMPLITRHNWSVIKDLWPLIIKSSPSEKESIVALVDALADTIHRYFPTIAIELAINNKSLDVGYQLARNIPTVDLTGFQNKIQEGELRLKEQSAQNLKAYEEMVSSLLDTVNYGKLHWRYQFMAVSFLRDLVHPDVKYNPEVVKFFLHGLVNDSIVIRKISLKVVLYMLEQNKPKFQKVMLDPHHFSKNIPDRVKPGIRHDNQWLLYNSDTIPTSPEQWDSPRFVHDEHTGYYCWPKEIKIYKAASEQPNIGENIETASEQLKEIHNFFNDPKNVELLVKYYSMEEKKGNDKFNSYRFMLFKYLFKIYGDKFLPILLPHIKKLVSDKQEQNQRCAAEIVCGIIGGCKHWSYEKVERLWDTCLPILRTAMDNISEEIILDWAGGISCCLQGRDPNRYHRLLEFLMDNPLNEQTSFISCARIYILQCAINQQPWRNAELIKRSLDYFENHLTHPFQNVRDKISWCLSFVFSKDTIFPNGNTVDCPTVTDFFEKVMPKLRELYEHTLNTSKPGNISNEAREYQRGEIGNFVMPSDDDKEAAVRLFKVVAKYVTISIVRTNYTAVPEHYELLPLACVLQGNELDEELSTICTNLIAMIGNTLILKKYVPATLSAIERITDCTFWSARVVIAEFVPVFVFHNMATIIGSPEWVKQILDLSLKLLQDTQPEVRVKAGHIFSGFLHCNFIPDSMELLKTFRCMAKTKLKPKTASDSQLANLRIRHAGVLGMCSYISARPYDVPDYVPAIFGDLSCHLNDPQPISAAIRKTLGDFKRTHHSSWELDKQKFTEDELSIISDLTMPPSYYA